MSSNVAVAGFRGPKPRGGRALVKVGGVRVKIVPGGPGALRSVLREDVGKRFLSEPVGVGHD